MCAPAPEIASIGVNTWAPSHLHPSSEPQLMGQSIHPTPILLRQPTWHKKKQKTKNVSATVTQKLGWALSEAPHPMKIGWRFWPILVRRWQRDGHPNHESHA